MFYCLNRNIHCQKIQTWFNHEKYKIKEYRIIYQKKNYEKHNKYESRSLNILKNEKATTSSYSRVET